MRRGEIFSASCIWANSEFLEAPYIMKRAAANTASMAKAKASLAATPSARPIVAPIPARLAAPRLRRAENSPMVAPTNGPSSSPGRPKNTPKVRAEHRPRHGAARGAEMPGAENARREIHGIGQQRQGGEHRQYAGSGIRKVFDPG